MAKVNFKRVENYTQVDDIPVSDGNFIVSGDGNIYVDYGSERKNVGGTLDTAMSDSSINGVQNKVVKKYVDDVNTTVSGHTTTLNKLETYSNDEIVIGTWFGKTLYRKCFSYSVYSGIKIPSDFDEVVSLICTIKSSQDSVWRTIPWNYQNDATWSASAYISTNGNISFYAGSNIEKFSKVNIIVEYTKK